MSFHMSSTDFLAFIVHCNYFLTYRIPRTFRVQGSSQKKKKKNSSRECKRLKTIERLKGHSQLWDCADLDTTFVSLKCVYLNPKSNVRVSNEHLHQLTVPLNHLFISPTNVGLPQKIKPEHTDRLNYIWDSLQKENWKKKKRSHCAWFAVFP